MKTRVWFVVLGLFVIAALGLWQGLTGDTLYHQKRNMKRAREFLPVVRAKLDEIPEFRNIRVSEYTAGGGSLLVCGDVSSGAEVQRVRDIVQSTVPPVHVQYQLIATNDFR